MSLKGEAVCLKRKEKKKKKMEEYQAVLPLELVDHDGDNQDGKKKVKRCVLVSFREVPEYMRDNEFIVGYYRVNWPLKEALFSLFRWHNETLNVWTHLIGFILFLGLTMANFIQVPDVADLLSFITRSFPMSGDVNVSHDSKQFFVGAADLKTIKPAEMNVPWIPALGTPAVAVDEFATPPSTHFSVV
ncbi:heptahelical transmembrane protein ADIPOR1-like [Carica papaya]|uniref:heptahelical transmembrane protein ADIPOR1-like n=1 Tax=Carica papaya TaxID=3649 RepID=UPI000B8CC642|nr:heptahelical transmembrane protein ADIPOR1-like [Carica papaya]